MTVFKREFGGPENCSRGGDKHEVVDVRPGKNGGNNLPHLH